MATTIQISDGLQKELSKRKFFDRETYEEVIWNVIEESLELNEETKREIKEARQQIKKGEYYTLSQVKRELKL